MGGSVGEWMIVGVRERKMGCGGGREGGKKINIDVLLFGNLVVGKRGRIGRGVGEWMERWVGGRIKWTHVANSPCDGAFFARGRSLVGLTFDACAIPSY